MGSKEEAGRVLAAKSRSIFPHLAERQRRLLMGAEARALSHGGIRLVARAARVREATVSLGVDELDSGAEPLGGRVGPAAGASRPPTWTPGCALAAGLGGAGGAGLMCAAHVHAVRLGVIAPSVPPAFLSASQPGV